MQEFLRGELERIVSRPSIEAWLERVRDRKTALEAQVTPADILRARDEDRS